MADLITELPGHRPFTDNAYAKFGGPNAVSIRIDDSTISGIPSEATVIAELPSSYKANGTLLHSRLRAFAVLDDGRRIALKPLDSPIYKQSQNTAIFRGEIPTYKNRPGNHWVRAEVEITDPEIIGQSPDSDDLAQTINASTPTIVTSAPKRDPDGRPQGTQALAKPSVLASV